jgi:hypothetical protein
MKSSPNIIGDDNVDINTGRKILKMSFFENLDLELMNDLENSVNNLSPENVS